MSRIHEALKKAEQERAPLAEHISAGDMLDSVSARKAPVATVEPEGSGLAADMAPQPSAGLTLDLLRQRCSRPGWSPDPKTMLFFHGRDHGKGTEEFRTLRARLYKIREKQPLKSLLITSALPAEGKSFVAANLAQVICRQHERRVLLIDGDLRKSRLHVSLGAPHSPGLSEYLRGDVDEFACIQQSPEPNLFFLPGGEPASNPAELLGNNHWSLLLEKMTSVFDWVIVDSPPAVPITDASVLARTCDGVLFVVLAGSTPFDLAQKACDEFRDKHLVGAVLNRMEAARGYGAYYKGYHYGYGAPNGKD
jgi:capsular exopolysaccharide synthesis family protein